MGFAAPLGLLALFSLVIPVLVHLRRRPARPVRIGTIRYLDGSTPRPRAGPRVSELVLMLVRLALLGLVAAALAEPFVAGDSASRPRRVAVTADSTTDLWTVLRSLDDTLPAGSSVALGIPARVTVSGARPFVATAVTIRAAPPAVSRAGAFRPAIRRLAIVAPPARTDAVRHLRAAFGAVAALRGDSLVVSERAPAPRDSLRGRWVVWLADPVAAESAAAAGASVLTESADRVPSGLRIGRADPGVFARSAGHGVLYEVPGRFDSGSTALAQGTLPELIAAIWPGDDGTARPMPVTAAQLQPARSSLGKRSRTPLATPLLVVAALVFLVERLLAHRGLGRSRVAA